MQPDFLPTCTRRDADGELAQARIELADAERLSTERRTLAARGAFPKSEADSSETAVEVKRATARQLE